jgi:hypothetical protein
MSFAYAAQERSSSIAVPLDIVAKVCILSIMNTKPDTPTTATILGHYTQSLAQVNAERQAQDDARLEAIADLDAEIALKQEERDAENHVFWRRMIR